VVPRYFTPELAEGGAPASTGAASNLHVRLGRVGGGSYLKERIAHRESDHEFGFYEDRRWTERPEVYLERALERSLFEHRGVKRAISGPAPTLSAELIEFEEVREGAPRVRLRVAYALHDERTVLRERSFVVERPLPSGPDVSRTERVAAALGDALRDAANQIVDDVVANLRSDDDPLVYDGRRRSIDPHDAGALPHHHPLALHAPDAAHRDAGDSDQTQAADHNR
jgi:ABC-type uncharacterized transport system auxiliary subunit